MSTMFKSYIETTQLSSFSFDFFDLISMINKVFVTGWSLHAFWLVLSYTYDLLEDKCISDITIHNFGFLIK